MKNIPWSKIIAVVSGLAGVAGAVVTPIYGSAMAGEVQTVLEAISGILVIVAGGAATSIVHAEAKAKIAVAEQIAHQTGVFYRPAKWNKTEAK